MSQPVIIEVAINGITRKDRNPNAPETPEEIAAEAVACFEQGAGVVHSHATSSYREPTDPDALAKEYQQAYQEVLASRPDAILYPTLTGGETIQQRWGHHEFLAEAGVIHCAAFDPGSVNLAGLGPDGLPKAEGYVYVNSPADIRYVMARCTELGIGPSMAIYEPGFFRTPLAYLAAGKLPPGTFSKFYFTGDAAGYFPGHQGPLFSAPPLPESLEMYLAMLGDAPLAWAVSVITGSLLDTDLAAMAVERGGHLRVGLEDNPTAENNLVQLKRAVELCESMGRRPATPTETRKILGLPS